ncbi:phosphotransferase family protein [Nonomuraea sp. 3N208]|uniref:phosphotransferase family protein n=1 Tax=Nonomuraea sp. 3N208 TaxID=3457421 RepID=UPI003FD37446
MTRPTWEELPDDVINAVQEQCGHVLKAENATAGIMPGVAARLDLEDSDRVFFKAIERTHEAARLHLRERWAGQSLPADVPAPRMLWSDTIGKWHVMVHQYVNDNAHHADLSPGSKDLPAVLDTMALLGALLTPCPNGAMPVSDNVDALMAKARHMLDKPSSELANRDLYEAAIDGFGLSALRGNTLLHYDLSAGNLLVTRGRVRVVDWSFAARGAAWLEAALFAPRLIEAGHTPEKTDELLSTLPHWHDAPRKAIAGLAAAWTLFRLYKAQHGPEQIRQAHARAADAGRSWLAYQQAKG